MSTVPTQHPAVVLRSTYVLMRALLALAAIAVVGLTVAVIVLAINNGGGTSQAAQSSPPSAVYNYPGHF